MDQHVIEPSDTMHAFLWTSTYQIGLMMKFLLNVRGFPLRWKYNMNDVRCFLIIVMSLDIMSQHANG